MPIKGMVVTGSGSTNREKLIQKEAFMSLLVCVCPNGSDSFGGNGWACW